MFDNVHNSFCICCMFSGSVYNIVYYSVNGTSEECADTSMRCQQMCVFVRVGQGCSHG